MLKTLRLAHCKDMGSVILMTSSRKDSSARPKNSLHFIEKGDLCEANLTELLQIEAECVRLQELNLEKSEQGVDYYLIHFVQRTDCGRIAA